MSTASDPLHPTLRTLLHLAWPIVLARATQSVIGFSDALMVAPLGEKALAAASMGAMNSFSVMILPMGVAFIIQSFAAQLKGRGDLEATHRYAWYGLMLAAGATALSLIAIPFVGDLLGLFSYEPEVRKLMTEYMVIRLFSVGAVIGVEALGNWYGGLGNTRLQMIAGIIAMVANIFLNWVLIGGHLGAPAMGVAGAALASSLASWISFGVVALWFAKGWGGVPKRTTPLNLTMSGFARVLRFGLPNGVNWFLEFAAFAVFLNAVMGKLGTAALAGINVVLAINSISFMPAFGLASSGAILVGQAVGAGAKHRVWPIVRLTGGVAITWMLTIAVVYVVAPDVLFSIFTKPGEDGAALRALGGTMLALSAAWQLFDAVAMTISESLRSTGDTTWPMLARIALAWFVFLPLGWLFVVRMGGGVTAAMGCIIGYIALLAAALAWRFRSGKWKRIELIEPTIV
jgi:multidrug resistance protein, MATE family